MASRRLRTPPPSKPIRSPAPTVVSSVTSVYLKGGHHSSSGRRMGRVTDHRTSPPERLGPCGSVTVVTGRRQVVFNLRRQLPRTFAGPRNYHARAVINYHARTVSYGPVSGSSVTSVRDTAAGGMASRRLRAPPQVNVFDPRRRRWLAQSPQCILKVVTTARAAGAWAA
jgi:hypothetical protein